MNSNILNALLGRYVESSLAHQLISDGYTLGKLKMLTKDKLTELGLSDETIQIISDESRPPIPQETIIKLLHESKFACCVCRNPSKGIIIHHIQEWNESKNHDESNLIVLCLEHHDLAHTKKDLTLQLSPSRLLALKKQWIESAKFQDARTILGLINEYSRWDYVNQSRVFELFLNLGIDPTGFQTYDTLKSQSIINNRGLINPIKLWDVDHLPRKHVTDIGRLQIHFMYYLKETVESIIKKLPIIDITNNLSRNEIKALVKPGMFISAQLGFYFKEKEPYQDFKSQRKTAYYRGNKIKIQFTFDAFECTSNSGRFDHMTAKKIITPILFVTSVVEDNGWINISTSCLAAGSYFDEHRIYKNQF